MTEATRQDHLAGLLGDAKAVVVDTLEDRLREAGFGDIRPAHGCVFRFLDEEGTRLTELAERAGMTKQGMGQLVLDLERQGYVARVPDPTDRRATLVRFTESGRRFLRDAVAVTRELETDYAALLGEARLEALRSALAALVDHERGRG